MAAEKELEDADAERGSQACNGGGAFVNKHGLPSRMAIELVRTARSSVSRGGWLPGTGST